MPPSDDRQLAKELRRYKRENAALRQQLAALRRERAYHAVHGAEAHRPTPSSDPRQARARALLRSRGRRAHHFGKRTYLRFLIDCFTDSTFYLWWSRVLAYARRIRLVRTVGLIVTVLLAAAQTSALFVVFSAVYLTVLPFLILGSGLGLLFCVLHSKTVNRHMAHALTGHHIRVLFPSRSHPFTPEAQAFFFASALEMATDPNVAVIVVSPYPLSTKGFGSRRMFATARQERPRLYIVRKYYYFILRRRVLAPVDPDFCVLY